MPMGDTKPWNLLATPAGLEPATLCLEGRCSIRLSYGARGCSDRSEH